MRHDHTANYFYKKAEKAGRKTDKSQQAREILLTTLNGNFSETDQALNQERNAIYQKAYDLEPIISQKIHVLDAWRADLVGANMIGEALDKLALSEALERDNPSVLKTEKYSTSLYTRYESLTMMLEKLASSKSPQDKQCKLRIKQKRQHYAKIANHLNKSNQGDPRTRIIEHTYNLELHAETEDYNKLFQAYSDLAVQQEQEVRLARHQGPSTMPVESLITGFLAFPDKKKLPVLTMIALDMIWHLEMSRAGEIITQLEELIEKNPTIPNQDYQMALYTLKGLIYAKEALTNETSKIKLDHTVAILTSIAKSVKIDVIPPTYIEIVYHCWKGDYERAIAICNKAIQVRPHNELLSNLFNRIQYLSEKDFEYTTTLKLFMGEEDINWVRKIEAAPSYAEAIALLKQINHNSLATVGIQVLTGKCLERNDCAGVESLLDYAKTLYQKKPNRSLLMTILRGRLYLILSEQRSNDAYLEETKNDLARGLELYPKSSEILYFNAMWPYIPREQAIAYFRQALKIDRENPSIHYQLGMKLIDAGKIKEGIENLYNAIFLEPEYSYSITTKFPGFIYDENAVDPVLKQAYEHELEERRSEGTAVSQPDLGTSKQIKQQNFKLIQNILVAEGQSTQTKEGEKKPSTDITAKGTEQEAQGTPVARKKTGQREKEKTFEQGQEAKTKEAKIESSHTSNTSQAKKPGEQKPEQIQPKKHAHKEAKQDITSLSTSVEARAVATTHHTPLASTERTLPRLSIIETVRESIMNIGKGLSTKLCNTRDKVYSCLYKGRTLTSKDPDTCVISTNSCDDAYYQLIDPTLKAKLDPNYLLVCESVLVKGRIPRFESQDGTKIIRCGDLKMAELKNINATYNNKRLRGDIIKGEKSFIVFNKSIDSAHK